MYKKHIILFILLISILSSTTIISYAEEKEKYPDVSPNNWYYEYVTELSDLGFINGYPDGLFHPEKTITNGEYFTLLFRVLNIDLEMYKKETDTHWASAATRKADYLDLSMQIKDTNDYINSAIDRKHAIKTTLKAIGLNDILRIAQIEQNQQVSILPLIEAGAVYLVLIGILTMIFKRIENKYSYYR